MTPAEAEDWMRQARVQAEIGAMDTSGPTSPDATYGFIYERALLPNLPWGCA